MVVLKDKTKSICPICYTEINARIMGKDGGVYLMKECPEHGKFDILIEKDIDFYKKLMNKVFLERKVPFDNLMFSLTHECNLSCNICYLPMRDNYNFSFEEMKRIISSFDGRLIRLSGAEPTLREDLPNIIQYIVKNGKIPVLLTNGLKLADISYLKKLKDAGLRRIHFSFNSSNDRVYEKIDGKKLLKIKLRALKNIKRLRIPIALSVMLVKEVNEHELKKIYRYCLMNNSFINQLRIRSAIHIGKYTQEEHLYLSEIVKMLSKIIGINEEKLVNHYLNRAMYYTIHSIYSNDHMPCHIEIDLFSLLMDEMGIRGANSLFKKIPIIFKLLPKVGLKNLIKMILRKFAKKKRLLEFIICIRVWPDKYRIDLGELQRCPSGYVTCDDNKILPFCYALILNEKDNIL